MIWGMRKLGSLCFVAALVFGAGLDARAEKSTVCTITVNSADEGEAFRRNLPEDKYQFVELVERGRPDWLASACRQEIRCDVLVVSGHFAGTEFYSSKFDANESLRVDEMERVQCSASCPGLFSQLKEVYLFGCDTLKPEPVRSATPEIVRALLRSGRTRAESERTARSLSERYGESSRDLMRRIFGGVPLIYGFSSLAPLGRSAGPLLDEYFESSSAAEEIGSGQPSARMLRLFGPSSMTIASGLRDSDPNAAYRRESCRFFDDRVTLAQKLELVHRTLRGDGAAVRMAFERIETFFASLDEGRRNEKEISHALAALVHDHAARARFLALIRDTEDPALRLRMIALARSVGWLSQAQQRAETVRMIGDLLATDAVGYSEVDLICALNQDRGLDRELRHVRVARTFANRTAHTAARACLGSTEARARVLRALASPNDGDVQVAQAYFRHRPITDSGELRTATSGIVRMPESAAQVRALETLARHHIADRETLEALTRLFAQATSVNVQRAIAEVFLRSDYQAIEVPRLVGVLREHRLESRDGADLIDVLIGRLEGS
jgi:hypothetical protein